ncbi:unnamed protein product [Nesidiocoris tenuis]|nr:unnamed protein product [Nesidiocoris tenuis]
MGHPTATKATIADQGLGQKKINSRKRLSYGNDQGRTVGPCPSNTVRFACSPTPLGPDSANRPLTLNPRMTKGYMEEMVKHGKTTNEDGPYRFLPCGTYGRLAWRPRHGYVRARDTRRVRTPENRTDTATRRRQGAAHNATFAVPSPYVNLLHTLITQNSSHASDRDGRYEEEANGQRGSTVVEYYG